MKASLCGDDVVVQMASNSQILLGSREGGGGPVAGGVPGGAGGELGRRLVAAARAGDTSLVRSLLALGAPLATDWLGTSALHVAAAHDRAETVAALVRAGVSRDARTKVERTPLHVAAAAGATGATQALLEHGAEVDCRDMLLMTPLHWAAERGHAGVAAALLRRGADPRAQSKFLKTPLSLARDPATRELIEAALRVRPPQPTVKTNQQTEHNAPSELNRQNKNSTSEEAGIQPEEKPQERDARAEAAAAQLLLSHGIAPLPADDGSTVLSALQSGRTVVLSDAGKLMLRESRLGHGGGVVLTATPVREPPAPGVKVFTVTNRTSPHQPAVTEPDSVTTSPRQTKEASDGAAEGARPTVKIIMNRANFTKLVSSALRAHKLEEQAGEVVAAALSAAGAGEEAVSVTVPERFVRSSSPAYLRSQLVAAHAALHALATHLRLRDNVNVETSKSNQNQDLP